MTNTRFLVYTLVVTAIGALIGASLAYVFKPAQIKTLEHCTYTSDDELLTTIKTVVKEKQNIQKGADHHGNAPRIGS